MIKFLLHSITTLPLLAFFLNMFVVAALGRELAIQVNGGNLATTTLLYSYITLLALHITLAISKHRKKPQ